MNVGKEEGAGSSIAWTAGHLRLVVIGLFLTGAGSLILEMVWSRMLKLVFGSTSLAISTVLAAYMLGLGLGGLCSGRIARRLRNPIRTYGWIEVGIGVYALLVPFLLQVFPVLNRELLSGLSFWPAALVRFAISLVVLLIPTMLMGATLPLVVQALSERKSRAGNRIGLLYGINTVGAVVGIAVATFVLLPTVGVRLTGVVGAGLDIAVGLTMILVLAPRFERSSSTDTAEAPAGDAATRGADSSTATSPGGARLRQPLLIGYGLVGLTALGFEVCWTRALTMAFGSSVYAFATILAVFLLGIGLGSLVGRIWVDRIAHPVTAYGLGVGLLGLLAFGTGMLLDDLPGFVVRSFVYQGMSGGALLLGGLQASFLVMFAPALVLGALFPLFTRALIDRGHEPAQAVGTTYFVNTLGSAAGAFLAGFVLLPQVGLSRAIAWLVAIDLAVAMLVLVAQAVAFDRRHRVPLLAGGSILALAMIAVLLVPPLLDLSQLAQGAYYRPRKALNFDIAVEPIPGYPEDRTVFYKDGINTTVSVHHGRGGLDMRMNGKPDASLSDMSTQVMAGQVPLLFSRETPRTALVIGLGSGVTAGSVATHPVDRIDVVEMEPAVREASEFFAEYNGKVLDDPRVRLIHDDARNFLSVTDHKYDLIISEPSNPWISGASSLFTREFFAEVSAHLEPGGRFLQWVQLYGIDSEAMGSIFAAMRTEFPAVYGFRFGFDDTDLLVLALQEPLTAEDLPIWTELPEAARRDLQRIGIHSTADLWSCLTIRTEEIDRAAEGRQPNSDDNLFVELHTPWTLYDTTASLTAYLEKGSTGVLPIVEGLLDEGDIGALALSQIWMRQEAEIAERWLQVARNRGRPATSVWTAEAALAFRKNRAEAPAALRVLAQAIEHDPVGFFQRYERAQILFQLRQELDTALNDLDVALEARPLHWPAHRLRLDLLVLLERYEEARAEAELLLASPHAEVDTRLWADAALIAGVLGLDEVGLNEMHHFFRFTPYSPEEWQWCADAYERLGMKDEAWWARERAQRILRNRARYGLRYALWQELSASPELARRTLLQLLQTDPDYAPAQAELDRIEQQIGLAGG